MRGWMGLLLAVLALAPLAARGETLKVAVPQRGAWDTSITPLGVEKGFFKEQGLDIEVTYTEGGASNEQAVISGSVDLTVQSGTLGIVAAYVKGAPVRIISAAATGALEAYWYVKAGSPITSLKEAHGRTVGFSNPGSSGNLVLLQLLKEAGVSDAKPLAVGASQNGLPMVMTGQIDICYAVPPVGLKELQEGKIVMIARGNDSPAVRNETIRVNVANLDALQHKRDAVVHFMRAYEKSLDWMFAGEEAVQAYAKFSGLEPGLIRYMAKNFSSREQNQIKEVKGMDRVLAEAYAARRIPKPMTPDEIKGIFDIVLSQGS